MRKIIVICALALMCMLYFAFIRISVLEETPKVNLEQLILEKKDSMIKEYPTSPKQVIEMHNQLMQYAYSQEMKEIYITKLVEAMRILYSKPLLEINSVEEQELNLLAELTQNQGNKIYIIDSELGDLLYKDENKVEASVKHFTTAGDIVRNYELIKEENQWKISCWEDQKAD